MPDFNQNGFDIVDNIVVRKADLAHLKVCYAKGDAQRRVGLYKEQLGNEGEDSKCDPGPGDQYPRNWYEGQGHPYADPFLEKAKPIYEQDTEEQDEQAA